MGRSRKIILARSTLPSKQAVAGSSPVPCFASSVPRCAKPESGAPERREVVPQLSAWTVESAPKLWPLKPLRRYRAARGWVLHLRFLPPRQEQSTERTGLHLEPGAGAG